MHVSVIPSTLRHVEISTALPLAPLHIPKPTSLSEPQLATLPALKIIPQSQQSSIGKLPHLHRFQPKNNLNPCVGCKSHKKSAGTARKRRKVSECVYPCSAKRKTDSSPASETAPSPKRNQIESIQNQPYRSMQTHCAQSGRVTNQHPHSQQQHIHQQGMRTPNQCYEHHEPQQRWNAHQSNVCTSAFTPIAPGAMPSLVNDQSIRKSNASSSSWIAASVPRAAECCL
ncbi:hypothetical protein BJ741DRAFT_594171 [Chytriomyces cf. hyalinus JEL632]|nr:hypothetical protein BJ741DRAFT_594171 [Chytriomyces cf. hyalinus JEL632]